jgi:hypothetical protein
LNITCSCVLPPSITCCDLLRNWTEAACWYKSLATAFTNPKNTKPCWETLFNYEKTV